MDRGESGEEPWQSGEGNGRKWALAPLCVLDVKPPPTLPALFM